LIFDIFIHLEIKTNSTTTTTTMQALKIKYSDFDPSKILDGAFVEKKSQQKNDPTTGKPMAQTPYTVMDIQYEYDVVVDGVKKTSVGPFYVELPEVLSPKGIEIKANLSGVDTPSLFCQFDLMNPEAADCVKHAVDGDLSTAGFFKQLYHVLATRLLSQDAKKVDKLKTVKTLEGIATLFEYNKTMVYEPLDSVTQEPIPGKNPSKFFNLVNQGERIPGNFKRKETIFSAPYIDPKTNDYAVIPWDVLLAGVEMKHKPLLWIKKLHIGSTGVSIQMEIVSSVVTSIVKSGSVTGQRDTLTDMEKNVEMTNAIKNQIAMLNNLLATSKGETPTAITNTDTNTATGLLAALAPPLALTDGNDSQHVSPPKVEAPALPKGVLGGLTGLSAFPSLSKLNA
jgi:hypothetical protein